MMIPFQVVMIPLYLVVHKLGMYDTYAGLILPKMANAISIFMMRSAFSGLPVELEESGRIDGVSEFGLFWRIMLPQCKPTIVTLIILGVNGAWNDLVWPLLVTGGYFNENTVKWTGFVCGNRYGRIWCRVCGRTDFDFTDAGAVPHWPAVFRRRYCYKWTKRINRVREKRWVF